MKSLQDRVNLVPVIAKSDTLTRREVSRLKTRVRTFSTAVHCNRFTLFILSAPSPRLMLISF